MAINEITEEGMIEEMGLSSWIKSARYAEEPKCLTPVTILRDDGQSTSVNIFSQLPRNYIGERIKVIQSTQRFNDSTLHQQEVYMGKKCIVNETIRI